ncbi:MAG: ABC transporter ATP-binding protein [Opitutaceae bacterium]|nr:ABC transporter ATP-binding protein [Opitutaceae bacterium]
MSVSPSIDSSALPRELPAGAGHAPVIEVVGLGKLYEANVPLRRWLARGMGLDRLAMAGGNGTDRGVAALSGVSFAVHKGEAFGIIGRNGAGKSTLLQILAGTLMATTGECRVRGRVTALLELGSGFNPEFTGRENIYLAGSILGIGRTEMDHKFPEIEEFADIGAFIEQPVKTYSTGMLMRVAFSVAVAVEPDILIIDEALSVGDILFQQKCNRRLRELLTRGVTLLVVTHDTAFVLNMCNRAMWLDKGKVAYLGDAADCVREYLTAMGAVAGNEAASPADSEEIPVAALPSAPALNLDKCQRLGDGGVALEKIWMVNEAGEASTIFRLGEWCRVVALVRAWRDVRLVSGGCELRDRHGQVIFATGLRVVRRLIDFIPAGQCRAVVMRFKLEIAPGQYTLDVGSGAGEREDNTWQRVVAAAVIEVSTTPEQEVVHGLARLPYEVSVYRANTEITP